MRYFLIILIALFGVSSTSAQTYEIGGVIGGANYIGDIGPTTYINPNTFMGGGIIKWNRSKRHSIRASILFAIIESRDKDSKSAQRKERGYSFNNAVREASLGMEYTFWDYDVHSGKIIGTPYLYTGITIFSYDDLYKKGDAPRMTYYGDGLSLAIPMVIGYKFKLNHYFSMGAEIGARYTLTDNMDGSNPNAKDVDNDLIKFGNTNSNDWYVFSGVTVTIAFGRKPCNSPY